MSTNAMNYIQLALIFANGFLISRIFIKCGTAERIVFYFIKKSKGHSSRIIYYVIYTAAILSMFIPNVITVLALLPIINILVADLKSFTQTDHESNTAFAMSNLYGANIGGTGSINGSASNAVLIGFLHLKSIPEVAKIDFITWIIWGFPFILVFCLVAGFAITRFLLPRELRKSTVNFSFINEERKRYPHEQFGVTISVVSFVFWLIVSSINMINKNLIMPYTTVFSLAFMLLLLYSIFILKMQDKYFKIKSRVLVIQDFFTDLPVKGFLIAGITIAASVILIYCKIDRQIVPLVNAILPPSASAFFIMFILCAICIYLSEFISNTTAAISLSLISLPICEATGINPFYILFGISLVSTVTFMSPVANAVNALAYGGVKYVSLKKMVRLGVFMDLVAVILVSLLATYILPLIYR